MADEGKMVRIVCATHRLTSGVLDGIVKATEVMPSLGFNGEATSNPKGYAYYLHPGDRDLQEFADQIAEVQGVLSASVVDIPQY